MIGIRRVVVSLAALWLAGVAPAQEGLYGPPAGEGTAMVRLLNASPAGGPLEVDLGAVRYGPLEFTQVSPYRPLFPDAYLIRAAGREQMLEPRPGAYYTVVVAPDAIRVLEDPAHRDPARAQLFLYNLTSLPEVDLLTADGKVRVISGVAPGGSAQVAVNPVPVELAVFRDGILLEKVGDLGLQRGQSYSVFVIGKPSGPAVLSARASVAME